MYIGRSTVVRHIAQDLYHSVLSATASLDPSRVEVSDKLRKDFNKQQQKFTQKNKKKFGSL